MVFPEGWPIHDIAVEPESGALFAGGGSPWYGATVFRSDDQGTTWSQSSDGLTYGDDAEAPKIATVWNVGFGHGAVFAGVEPAGLFRSDDGGKTWSHVSGLRDHPSRAQWQPGAGGLILHSIVSDPDDARRMWVGISAVGTFATEDGGATWENRALIARNIDRPWMAIDATSGPNRGTLYWIGNIEQPITYTSRDGARSFSAPLTLTTGAAPSNLALFDVNGDGLPDIVATDQASGDDQRAIGAGAQSEPASVGRPRPSTRSSSRHDRSPPGATGDHQRTG